MNLNSFLIAGFCLSTVGTANIAAAREIQVTIHMIDQQGIGQSLGTIKIEDTNYGLLLTPNLENIPPGIHGFHVHENPNCNAGTKDGKIVPGLLAGGHYDPNNTQSHQGPYGNGHLGDLPPLIANQQGIATLPILAPRLKESDLQGRSLIVHFHGDNFSDIPEKLGGGGGRLACGIIQGE
jgi:Cu-Zn family superoxide dismutase